MRTIKPEQFAALALAIFVIAIFDVEFRGTSPAKDEVSQARPIRLVRLRPGFLVLESDVENAMVLDRHRKEDYDKSVGRTPEIKAAWRETDRADLLWQRGKRMAAIDGWKAVVKTHPGTEAAFAAQSNIAQTAFVFGERSNAIRAYRTLIDFPAPVEHDSSALTNCSNLRHYACAELSDLYLESGDLPLASGYAELALNKYPLGDFCGVWLESYNQCIRDRIMAIKTAIALNHSPGIEPRVRNW